MPRSGVLVPIPAKPRTSTASRSRVSSAEKSRITSESGPAVASPASLSSKRKVSGPDPPYMKSRPAPADQQVAAVPAVAACRFRHRPPACPRPPARRASRFPRTPGCGRSASVPVSVLLLASPSMFAMVSPKCNSDRGEKAPRLSRWPWLAMRTALHPIRQPFDQAHISGVLSAGVLRTVRLEPQPRRRLIDRPVPHLEIVLLDADESQHARVIALINVSILTLFLSICPVHALCIMCASNNPP